MLREIRDVRQIPGEPRRRWFFSHEQDLVVWFNEDGRPSAFQLAYGKYRDEHTIRWKEGQGFAHDRVDDGEGAALGNATPLLIPDGAFQARDVLEEFLERARDVPKEIVEFVADA